MKWLLVERQSGSGCDYSIECGTKVTIFDADSAEQAWSLALDLIGVNRNNSKNEFFESIETLVIGESARIACHLIPFRDSKDILSDYLVPTYEKLKREQESDAKKASEDKERAEYKRLKKKFEKEKHNEQNMD